MIYQIAANRKALEIKEKLIMTHLSVLLSSTIEIYIEERWAKEDSSSY